MPGRTIRIHREAPAKPPLGAPCNGCGVCCLVETCPAARALFHTRHGPCPALLWRGSRYDCGLVATPADFIAWLPAMLAGPAQTLFRRWIAAGKGCDCDIELETDATSAAERSG